MKLFGVYLGKTYIENSMRGASKIQCGDIQYQDSNHHPANLQHAHNRYFHSRAWWNFMDNALATILLQWLPANECHVSNSKQPTPSFEWVCSS